MQPRGAIATDIVLLGAGAAHLEMLRAGSRCGRGAGCG